MGSQVGDWRFKTTANDPFIFCPFQLRTLFAFFVVSSILWEDLKITLNKQIVYTFIWKKSHEKLYTYWIEFASNKQIHISFLANFSISAQNYNWTKKIANTIVRFIWFEAMFLRYLMWAYCDHVISDISTQIVEVIV